MHESTKPASQSLGLGGKVGVAPHPHPHPLGQDLEFSAPTSIYPPTPHVTHQL